MLLGPMMAIRCPARSPCADNPAATASTLRSSSAQVVVRRTGFGSTSALGLSLHLPLHKISEVRRQSLRVDQPDRSVLVVHPPESGTTGANQTYGDDVTGLAAR